MTHETTILPHCPRCGYDQSGAIAAWERSDPACCPLTGICTECGSSFEWGDIFAARARRLPIAPFEEARRRRLASFFGTTWKATRPRSFWSWAGQGAEARWTRILLVSAGGGLLVHLSLAAVPVACGQIALLIDPPPSWGLYRTHSGGFPADLWIGLWPWGRPPFHTSMILENPVFLPRFAIAFVTIAFMTLLSITVSLAQKQRLSSTLRVIAYGVIGAPLSHGIFLTLGGVLGIAEAVETRMVREPEMSWSVREFLGLVGDPASIGGVIVWWLLWWGFAGARCLHWRRPWITAAAIGAVSCLFTLVLFTSIESLWLWVGKYWQ